MTKQRRWFKRIGLALLALVLALVLAVGGYVLYLQTGYYRIPDGAVLTVENPQTGQLAPGQDYTALTYNIGFGAYGPDYSFFMDTGTMADGTPVQGRWGKAKSKDAVLANTQGALETIAAQNADFLLLQEVDVDAHRSYQVDQRAMLRDGLPGYGAVFASNFHTRYLFYPFHDPHGAVDAGLLTFSRYSVSGAVRRSYPVDESFFVKFTDLDRCFAQLRIPVEGGGELVLINSHMSAYDEGGTVRARQLEMLCGVMCEEYEKGNYVIVGGDFNHALGEGMAEAFESGQQLPGWVAQLTDEDLPEGFSLQRAENQYQTPTCRTADIPWEPGVNYTTVLDGFIVSDNITATAEHIDTNFAYSDHNPVKLTFRLGQAAE